MPRQPRFLLVRQRARGAVGQALLHVQTVITGGPGEDRIDQLARPRLRRRLTRRPGRLRLPGTRQTVTGRTFGFVLHHFRELSLAQVTFEIVVKTGSEIVTAHCSPPVPGRLAPGEEWP